MEFIHGLRVMLRYDEMSPLDRAINNYYKQAKKYFDALNIAESSPEDIREMRKKELLKVKKHLERERRLMENIVDVQARLELYRVEGRKAVHKPGMPVADFKNKQNELQIEEYHPTGTLEKFMRAVPVPKPSKSHTAHHIVPGKGKTQYAYRARVRIHLFGVRINDPDNGVWLPSYAKHIPHWSMPESLGHLQYHTEGYERWVEKKLRNISGEEFIRMELRLLGLALQQNNLPPEARKKVV